MATSGRVCARHLAHVKYYINSYSFLTRSRKVTFDTHQVAYNHNCVRILSHMVPLAHVSVKDRLSIPVRVGRTAGNGTNAGSNAISRAVRDLTSGTCSSPDLSFEFCEEESKQGGRSKGNARIGYVYQSLRSTPTHGRPEMSAPRQPVAQKLDKDFINLTN